MTPQINLVIKFVERLISFIINLFWIPSFITPPNRTPVDFLTEEFYVLAGNYFNGEYKYYPASYKKVYAWRPRVHISLPKFKPSALDFKNVTFLFNPKTDNVWEYKDLAGEKHHVSYNTRKLLEKNPFNTTVEDKNSRIQEQKEIAQEKNHAKVKAIKGNTL